MNINQDIERQKKIFALVLDASSFILKAKGFQIHRIRAVIDALQGAAGGRKEFACAHLNLAHRLDTGNEKGVSPVAEIRRVQRLLAVLESEQKRVGKKVFTIIRGGGADHKVTRYIDNLTELAVLAIKKTQEKMSKENINPSEFKKTLGEEAANLSDNLPDIEKEKDKMKIPLDDDFYIQRECNHSVNSFERGLERWLSKGGDVESFVKRHEERLRKRADLLKSKISKATENKSLDFSEVVALAASSEMAAEAKEMTNTNDLQTNSNPNTEPDMLQEALNLAGKGFRIFPVYEPTEKGCSCKQGERCENAGKHPRILEWQKSATTNENQIKIWWQKWDRANIGIATGKGSNVIVLDVDANKGGDASLSELFEDSELPETLTAKTGNGFHLFFKTTESFDVKNSVDELGEGLDIRGEFGFVVASPSLHRNGKRYSWMNEIKPCSLPKNLKEKLIQIKKRKSSEPPESKTVSQPSKLNSFKIDTSIIPESTRNATLFRKAASLRGKGLNESEILERLHEVNRTQCVPQLEDNELQKIARSVMRYLPEKDKGSFNTQISASV